MSGLILKLSPKERILINGAVIENGERRTRLAIKTPDAHILRLRDAIHPNDANTPVKRLCYTVQLVLSGDLCADETGRQVARNIQELSSIFVDDPSQNHLARAAAALQAGDHYRCLKSLRFLLQREEQLLAMSN